MRARWDKEGKEKVMGEFERGGVKGERGAGEAFGKLTVAREVSETAEEWARFETAALCCG